MQITGRAIYKYRAWTASSCVVLAGVAALQKSPQDPKTKTLQILQFLQGVMGNSSVLESLSSLIDQRRSVRRA